MSLRKKTEKREKGLPQRKSMAGPMMLGAITQPGAIRKSLVTDMFGKRASQIDSEDEAVTLGIPLKDYTALEGRVKMVAITDVNKEILSCKYNEEYDYLAAGCSDGTVMVYRTDSCELVRELIDDDVYGSTAPVTAIQHRPVSKNYPITHCFTCTYANGFVKSWNYNFNQCIYTIKENRECFGITYHPRYPKFVTYGDDSKIYLYDEESQTQERILSSSNNPKIHDGHTSRVFSACFHPRSNYELLTGGWDDVVQFWDLRQPHATRHIGGVHMCGEGIDINFKGTDVLTCAFQNKKPFQIFDYGSGSLISTLSSLDEEVSKLYTGKYCAKDYAVCGGTQPNLFRIIDLASMMSVASVIGLPSAVYSLDLGPPKKSEVERSDVGCLPQMAFVSGRKLYQVDFI